MARPLPAPHTNSGSVRYRCRTVRAQLEALELALLVFVWRGGDLATRRWLRAIRDQLDLIEQALPEQEAQAKAWKREGDTGPPPRDEET